LQSKAKSVEQYLIELPEDRRETISHIRNFILENLPDGYVESMNWVLSLIWGNPVSASQN
jgi:hypothetical protein